MVDIRDILKQVEPRIGTISEGLVAEFKKNLLRVFKTEAVSEIKNRFLAVYDELAADEESQAGSEIKGKDPTSLKNLRGLFVSQISRELSNNITIEGNEIVIRLMDKNLLGYGGSSETRADTVDVLAFYLEGIAGDFAFITPQHLKKRRPGSDAQLGRFGKGFMITRREYERDNWERITGIPFEDVRHPVSGQPPFKGFREAANKIDFSKYINKALEITVDSLRNSKV